ncbi:hypothetical protein C1645_814633 [Glomus cerebriforme]|uniref:Phosphatidylglycerol/phosphatidylinositol transfer protein n=1 Tax=Glomus cerebriforme TaxID=658196 RepID=A0A397TGE2_9GLOM|nr:hypothetical protein C1645_814633 [Glomus cerebriforme]
MKRNYLIFVVILLTTLSIINAVYVPLRKRATDFTNCSANITSSFDLVSNANPPASGTFGLVSLTVNQIPKDIEKVKFTTDLQDPDGKSLKGFPVDADGCVFVGVKCPIQAGSRFSVTYPVDIPVNAPAKYTLLVILSDDTNGIEIVCSGLVATVKTEQPDTSSSTEPYGTITKEPNSPGFKPIGSMERIPFGIPVKR